MPSFVTDVSSLRDLWGFLLVLLLPMYHPYGICGDFVGVVVTDVSSLRDLRGILLVLLLPMYHPYGICGGFLLVLLLPMYHPYGICGGFCWCCCYRCIIPTGFAGDFVGVVTDVSSLRDLRGILLVLLLPMFHPYGIYGGFLLVPYGICGVQ